MQQCDGQFSKIYYLYYFRSLDSGSEQQALDLKRQLQVIEQEANILRTKNNTLESDNEKLAAENRRLLLQKIKKSPSETEIDTELKDKVISLETQLADSNNKVSRHVNRFVPLIHLKV